MAVPTTQQSVAALYIAIFNRAPDKGGLDYWTAQVTAGASIASVAAGFAANEVFTSGIGALGNAAYVAALYTNILGSAGDAAGVAYWTSVLNAGASKSAVVASFVQASLSVDIPAAIAAGTLSAADGALALVRQQTLTNKVDVGIYFATTLGNASNLNPLTVTSSKAGLEADPIYNASKAAIANVTNVASTVTDAKSAIAVAAGTTNPAAALLGGTFTLTTAADTFNGGLSNDTFNADSTTFSALDTINGGAGKDTFNYTDAGTVGGNIAAGQVSNVEIINIRNVNGTAAVAATKEVATVTFGTVAAGQTVIIGGVTFTGAVGTGSTAAEAAAYFSIAPNIPAGYTVTSTSSGTQVVFSSVALGNQPNLTVTGTATGQSIVVVDGVAAVTSTGVNDVVAATNFVGATNFNSNLSTNGVEFTGLVAGQQVGITGNGAVVNGALTASYGATVTSTTLNVAGGTKGGTVLINGNGLTAATINSTGAANTVGTVTLGTALTGLTINAETNLTATSIAGFAAGTKDTNTITANGIATSVNIGTISDNVGVVNAAGLTLGGVTAGLGNNTTIKFTGGAGNDVITTGSTLITGASVNAGAGTADRLVVAATGNLTTASAAFYKGFEQISVGSGVTADVSLLAAGNTIDTVIIAGGAVAAGVTGLTATQAGNVQITSTGLGALTIGVAGSGTAGQIDTVKAALTTVSATGVANGIDLSGIILTNVEKLALTANGTATAAGAVTLTTAAALALDSITLTSAGTNSITISNGHTASNLVVDASASTGNTTINASAYAVTGASLKGGSGSDILIGGTKADVITGGAGNDLLATGAVTTGAATATAAATVTAITGTTAGDTLTGGAGNDNFAIGYVAAGSNNAELLANIASITDLNLGTNVVTGSVDGLYIKTGTPLTPSTVVTLTDVQKTAITGAADLLTATGLALAANTAVNAVVQFTFGADTYLVNNGVVGGTAFVAGEDTLIKITGVTGVLDASDIHYVA